MADAHADMSKHVRVYIAVFIALAFFTVLTVLAATIEASTITHVGVAMIIAIAKASLVAAVFMHLKWERSPSLWWVLILCAIFFVALMALPVLTMQDMPPGVTHSTWG